MRIRAYKLSGRSVITDGYAFTEGDSSQLLDWLIFGCTAVEGSSLKVVWDLSQFSSAIFSYLPEHIPTELSRHPHRTKWGNYRLYYIPDKVLSVTKNGSESSFYDLSQYFPGETEPADLDGIQQKANLLREALTDLGAAPVGLASPVSAFKGHKMLSSLKDTIPTIFDASEDTLDAYEIALQCTPREWVSNYQVGDFPEIWSYDLSSAYPWQASFLPDLRDCAFTRSASLIESACYGFLVGDFTVDPNHPYSFCSPFLADRGDGVLVNFVGTKREHYCLLDEVRTLYQHDMGSFKLKDGWFVSPIVGTAPRKPFQSLMGHLYSQRGETELKSYLVKRVMNGLIGKLLETHKDADGNILEYGDLYNPIYHAVCTTRTRLQVFDFLVQNETTRDELVFVGVDGVKCTRRLDLPGRSPMGQWRCSGDGPAIVLSPGAVLTLDRNFKKTGYAELVADCLAHPTASKFGADPHDLIDLKKLFLNQTRTFAVLPQAGAALLNMKSVSDPIQLED